MFEILLRLVLIAIDVAAVIAFILFIFVVIPAGFKQLFESRREILFFRKIEEYRNDFQ